jgi:U1 small nuclear ribonucleoprotein
MTAQLPPNLLKLFAPRPPLLYSRPVGKSPNTIRPKNVDGVFGILQQIREESAISIAERGKSSRKAKKDVSAKKGGAEGDTAMANGDTKEEGEEDDQAGMGDDLPEDPTKEPGFTYAEETRRQIAREEKAQRRKEAFEKAKASCKCLLWPGSHLCRQLAVTHEQSSSP